MGLGDSQTACVLVGFGTPNSLRPVLGAWGAPHIPTIGDIHSIADIPASQIIPSKLRLAIPPKLLIFFRLCIEFCKGSPSVQSEDFGFFRDIPFGEGTNLSIHRFL